MHCSVHLSYSKSLSPYISNAIHNGPRTLTYCLNQVTWCSVMTAVSKVARQDPANARFRSKLEKSIIQPQLTFCSYITLCTQRALDNYKRELGLANYSPAQ